MLRFSRTRIGLVSVIVACAVLLALPTFLGERGRALLPSWLPVPALALGFDLKGGTQLILELDPSVNRDGRIGAKVKEALEVISRRVALFSHNASGERAIVERQSKNRILVQVPGVDDVARLKNFLNQTADISFRFAASEADDLSDAMAGNLPDGFQILYSPDDPPQTYLVEEKSLLGGRDIEKASAEADGDNAIVRLTLKLDGARKLQDITRQNIGRRLAVVLDGDVISAPVIRQPITTGAALLSGSFSLEQAQDIAAVLNGGMLPARFNVVAERTVFPGMGHESGISAATAAFVAAIATFVLMVIAYGLYGIFAVVSVCVHMAMVVGIMALVGVPLSVPGIAALILTIAMAVDSNVIIYERIRDESRLGKRTISAIDKGFSRAFATIFDANIVLLLIVAVLGALAGAGPVRGFAITMAIGIVTTVFTAYSVNRLIIAMWLRLNPPPRELPL
jgi:protein-export membrane protein SecD